MLLLLGVALSQSVLVELTSEDNLQLLRLKVDVMYKMVARECPGRLSKRSVDIDTELNERVLKHLREVLARCRREKARNGSVEEGARTEDGLMCE